MEATHRYRLLIYFVALVLCLSACFAFAEEPAPSDGQQPARLLFQMSGARSAFMPQLNQSFLPMAPATETQAIVSSAKLDQISAGFRKSHGLLHTITGPRHKTKVILTNPLAAMHAGDDSLKNSAANFSVSDQSQR